MTDVFGYDVIVCMNITDIDDKIIDRSIGERACPHVQPVFSIWLKMAGGSCRFRVGRAVP
jgi:cysteinyl-tRNA synthetase